LLAALGIKAQGPGPEESVLDEGGGVNSGTDDAKRARRKGFAMMASTAAEAHDLEGADEETRSDFGEFWHLFAASAGIVPSPPIDPPRRRLRVVSGVALVILLALGVGGAWTVADIQLKPSPKTKQNAPSVDPALGLARAADPTESDAWGVRAFLGDNGTRCVRVGRVVQQRLGKRIRGRFIESSGKADRKCMPPGQRALVATENYGSGSGRGPRSVAYGLVGRDVHIRIGIRPPGREVQVADDGTFVYVRAGIKALDGSSAYLYDQDGRLIGSRALGAQ